MELTGSRKLLMQEIVKKISTGVIMGSVIRAEDEFVILEESLHSDALLLYVGHFTLDGHGAHYGRSKDHGEIEWGHLTQTLVLLVGLSVRRNTYKVLSLMLDDARKVENKELEAVTVRAG